MRYFVVNAFTINVIQRDSLTMNANRGVPDDGIIDYSLHPSRYCLNKYFMNIKNNVLNQIYSITYIIMFCVMRQFMSIQDVILNNIDYFIYDSQIDL